MREEQEGRWENILQTWLDKVSPRQENSYAKLTALMSAVSAQSKRIIEKLFGRRLLSLRAFGVSLCYGMASLFLTLLLSPFLRRFNGGHQVAMPNAGGVDQRLHLPGAGTTPLFVAAAMFGYFLALGSVPALIEKSDDEPLWVWKTVLFGQLLIYVATVLDAIVRLWGFYSAFRFAAFMCLLLSINFLLDVVFVRTVRWMLTIASNTRQLLMLIVAILFDVLLGVGVVLAPVLLGLLLITEFHGEVMSVGFMAGFALKSVDFVIACMVLIILLLIAVHGAIWFVLERPIYSCLRFKVIRNKTLLWWAIGGLALVPYVGLGRVFEWALSR
jgi:hypothetical protein